MIAKFDSAGAEQVWDLMFEGAWPTTVAFLDSGRRLAAGNRDGVLYIWDLPEKPVPSEKLEPSKSAGKTQLLPSVPPVRRLDGHEGQITRLITTQKGGTLISASFDRTLRLWDPASKPSGTAAVVLDVRTREKRRKNKLPVQPEIQVLTQTSSRVLQGHRDWINALGVSADERRLISGDDSGLVIVRDLPSTEEICRWTGHPGNWISSAALSSSGKLAFVAEYCSRRGDFDRPPAQARIWDLESMKVKIDLLQVRFPDVKMRDNSYSYGTKWAKFVARGFVAAAFSPDDRLLALGQGGETDTGRVHLIDVESGKLIRSVSGHRYGVNDLMFSSDGKFVISSGRDTTVRIASVEDGKEVATLGKPRGGQFKDWLHAVSLSPDEGWLAAADIAGRIQVWRLGRGEA